MALGPKNPVEFREAVRRKIAELYPQIECQAIAESDLALNGRRIDLEQLRRMVEQNPSQEDDVVENFLNHLINSFGFRGDSLNKCDARRRLMPRIQPESIFERMERNQVAHLPFVNGTVIVAVLDFPHMTMSVTTEHLVKWGISDDELDQVFRENLVRYHEEFEVQFVEARNGGKAVVFVGNDGYDASRVLLPDLHSRLAPELGSEFYVAIPARDLCVAFSLKPAAFVRRLQERAAHDFRRLPYPITDQLFLVTRDGVAGMCEGVESSER